MKLLGNLHTRFINLDHRIDRLAHMKRQLAKAGVEAEKFRAFKTSEHLWDAKKTAVMRARTPGAIGCYYSQLAVMEEAFKTGKHAFVLEDDVIFCDDFQARLIYIDRFCQHNPWDVIWLGGTFHVKPPYWHRENNPELPGTIMRKDAQRIGDKRMIRTYGAFSTYAYIVNVESLDRIMQLLDEVMQYSMGIDWSFIHLQPSLLTYAFVPGCCKQIDNKSDIGTGITYFSGFAKLGEYWYQEKMTDFDPDNFDWGEAGKNT